MLNGIHGSAHPSTRRLTDPVETVDVQQVSPYSSRHRSTWIGRPRPRSRPVGLLMCWTGSQEVRGTDTSAWRCTMASHAVRPHRSPCPGACSVPVALPLLYRTSGDPCAWRLSVGPAGSSTRFAWLSSPRSSARRMLLVEELISGYGLGLRTPRSSARRWPRAKRRRGGSGNPMLGVLRSRLSLGLALPSLPQDTRGSGFAWA